MQWLLQITTGAASLALAISLAAAGWPAPAPAVTPEQLLFLEVRTSSNQASHHVCRHVACEEPRA